MFILEKAHSMTGNIIEIAISVLLLAVLVGGVSLPVFFGIVNTSAWSATDVVIWTTIPTIALATIIISLVNSFRKSGSAE